MPLPKECVGLDEAERAAFWYSINGSVVPKTVLPVAIFTIYAATVVAINELWKISLTVPPYMVPILSGVVGFLLVFRTNTAYDRYWEGRRVFGQLTTNVRNMSRLIWIACPEDTALDKYQKRTTMRLLIAFMFATKHALRTEHFWSYRDITRFVPASLRGASFCAVPGDSDLVELSDDESTGLLGTGRRRKGLRKNTHRADYGCGCPVIPLKLLEYVTAYIHNKREKEQITLMMGSTLFNLTNTIVESFTSLERIRCSPIPPAYRIHLSQILIIQCFFIPFQFVRDLSWVAIPVTAIFVFTLFGIEYIGQEIENPFGLDKNDLPLELFCEQVEREILLLLRSPPLNPDDWLELSPITLDSPPNTNFGGNLGGIGLSGGMNETSSV
ncbi:Bestrophin, RFP-TM, chloride channel-domain-containing protein [Cladochytrium replicatum]|nr:Bestrophin, RFP-TM, chloride channel-domain-containing protein [Cladochytrium replicatum]